MRIIKLLSAVLHKLGIFATKLKNKLVHSIIYFIPNTKRFIITSKFWLMKIGSFLILLNAYLVMKAISKIMSYQLVPELLRKKLLPIFEKSYFKVVRISNSRVGTINRINLIELALKNMTAKKTRTFITIGGMSIGIATIVFLVSLGYGLQSMVTSRVARLDEMKQAEISTMAGSNLKLNDEVLTSLKEFPEIDKLLPMVALVAKINYKNSVTDTAVFGVTAEYLQQSAIKPSRGEIFDSNDISFKTENIGIGEVAGTSIVIAKIGEKIRDVSYNISVGEWVELREKASEESKLLGYTKRLEGQMTGSEVWGSAYGNGLSSYNSELGYKVNKWLYAKVPLWEISDGQYVRIMNSYGTQEQKMGYMKTDSIKVEDFTILSADVLGITTSTSESTDSVSGGKILQEEDGWVSIEGITQGTEKENIVEVPLGDKAKLQAVVNRSFLKILGIEESDSIGQKFLVSFIVPSSLIETPGEKIQSNFTEYSIVGVIPAEDTAYFYVPLIDIKTLGVINYSQIKMVVKNQDLLASARNKTETMGYVTTSVVDTVAQIDSLFNLLRRVLALVGAVALSVAALGMFNTLTVSLLERIREIGLMKAMGMKSDEIEELFLTESMVMGFFGGVVGLILGYLAGKLLGLIISSVAVLRGVGMIDISYIPPLFVLLIISLSLLVGLLTGIYPSRRAKNISALNALRYE
jgi:ABC-type antimicrobial peptide transport system permease subunit